MSRPRKLCEHKQSELCTLMACGCPLAVAARHLDCSVYTIRREARRNPEFEARLRGALLDTELAPIAMLQEAAQTDWRAAAWLLERTHPEQYGRRAPSALGRAELSQLVERLGNVVRDEIHDRRQAARLRHRIRVEVQAVLGKFRPLKSEEKAVQLAHVERSPEESVDLIQSIAAESKMAAEREQNVAKLTPEPTRAAGGSPWNSRPVLSASA